MLHKRTVKSTPLHAMSNLGLDQSLGAGDEGATDRTDGDHSSGGHDPSSPLLDLDTAGASGAAKAPQPHTGVGDSAPVDIEPGQQLAAEAQPRASTPYSKLLAFYQQRDMAELGANGSMP